MPTVTNKKRLTKKEMIVAVAKDVIKLTKIKAPLRIRTGIYLSASDHNYKSFGKKELQDSIPKIAKDCTVCALGAMVLAKIHCFNGATELPIGEVREHAAKLVGQYQADEIENAFESCTKYADDDTLRLRAIMRNIVKNNGVFDEKQFQNSK